jgi:hypothetical protein
MGQQAETSRPKLETRKWKLVWVSLNLDLFCHELEIQTDPTASEKGDEEEILCGPRPSTIVLGYSHASLRGLQKRQMKRARATPRFRSGQAVGP